MNICIESQLLNHPRRSGLMTYTEGLINSLRRHDRENDYTMVYYSLTRPSSVMPGEEKANFKKAVVRVPDNEMWGRQFFLDSIMLPQFLKQNKFRVFHRPSGYTMPDTKGIYKVLTVHDLRTLTIGDQRWMQNIATYQKTIARVDMCVVVSDCTKMDLITHFKVPEKKIKVAYLGADERFRPAAPAQINAVKEKYGIEGPFFLSIGSVPRKNIDGIIRGFAGSEQKNNFRLILSCNQDIEKYKSLIAELGLEKRVLILDKLGDDEVVALYSGCHAFLFPSLYEGFGLPILEAFQCGAPVVTSNISSCPEVAGDAAILVDPLQPQELSAAIDQLARNDGLRKSLIEKGHQRAKLFSWDNFGQAMKKVYAAA